MKKVHIVPHSHWDREWYFTIEDSNALLVEHMDYLINYLEDNLNYPHFVFDGQLSIVEEYLKLRPENEQRLKNLITKQRIFVGPWYTQCDSLDVKLESVIRNLEYGIYLGHKYGHSMNIGYLPDAFGQNAYLPSIFKQCGLDYSILQRGIYNEQAEKGLNFKWQAPNGEIIATNYIYFGYGPGKFLATDNLYLKDKLLPILGDLQKMSGDEELLLPSGGDQALIRTHFIDTIKDINMLQNDYQLVLSNYEKFMGSISFDDKQVIKGELYASQKSRMHRTIHSQRIDLKSSNTEVERLIIEQLEPLVLIAKKLNIPTNDYLIDIIWKKMFDIHAHDSIGGCNSDSTNKKIIARLDEVQAMVQGQINLITKKITKINLANENGLVVFNFANISDKLFKARIYTRKKQFKLMDENTEIKLLNIKQTEIDGGFKVEVTNNGEQQVELPSYYQTDIEFKLNELSFGYKTLNIIEIDHEFDYLNEPINVSHITTEFYKLDFTEQLVINEHVKLGFEVQSDVGDSYDFAYLEGETPLIETKIVKQKIKELDSYYEVNLVHLVNFKHVNTQVETKIVVSKFTNDLKISHKILNTCEDYRLRVIFLKTIDGVTNEADSGFGVIIRDNVHPDVNDWQELKYAEKPQAIYPFERFFKVDDLSIYGANVKEYEVLEDYIALTLLRSVSYLGQDDLTTRPGRASGINNVVVKTPDAKLLNKEIEVSYWLNLYPEDNYSLYSSVANNYVCYQNQDLNLFDNRLDRFELPIPKIKIPKYININLPKLHLSSAYCNKNGDLVYRLFNSQADYYLEHTSYNINGDKKVQDIVSKNDYITIKDEDVKEDRR